MNCGKVLCIGARQRAAHIISFSIIIKKHKTRFDVQTSGRNIFSFNRKTFFSIEFARKRCTKKNAVLLKRAHKRALFTINMFQFYRVKYTRANPIFHAENNPTCGKTDFNRNSLTGGHSIIFSRFIFHDRWVYIITGVRRREGFVAVTREDTIQCCVKIGVRTRNNVGYSCGENTCGTTRGVFHREYIKAKRFFFSFLPSPAPHILFALAIVSENGWRFRVGRVWRRHQCDRWPSVAPARAYRQWEKERNTRKSTADDDDDVKRLRWPCLGRWHRIFALLWWRQTKYFSRPGGSKTVSRKSILETSYAPINA